MNDRELIEKVRLLDGTEFKGVVDTPQDKQYVKDLYGEPDPDEKVLDEEDWPKKKGNGQDKLERAAVEDERWMQSFEVDMKDDRVPEVVKEMVSWWVNGAKKGGIAVKITKVPKVEMTRIRMMAVDGRPGKEVRLVDFWRGLGLREIKGEHGIYWSFPDVGRNGMMISPMAKKAGWEQVFKSIIVNGVRRPDVEVEVVGRS